MVTDETTTFIAFCKPPEFQICVGTRPSNKRGDSELLALDSIFLQISVQ
jgi:hypothetical protein